MRTYLTVFISLMFLVVLINRLNNLDDGHREGKVVASIIGILVEAGMTALAIVFVWSIGP